MSRQEFPARVKRDALKRAAGSCEGLLPDGTRCPSPLTLGKYAFDHVIADQIGGRPELSNCAVLCTACHKEKTKRDVALIAKAKRREAKHLGTSSPKAPIQSRGFAKAEGQRRASRPVDKLAGLPRKTFTTTPGE